MPIRKQASIANNKVERNSKNIHVMSQREPRVVAKYVKPAKILSSQTTSSINIPKYTSRITYLDLALRVGKS